METSIMERSLWLDCFCWLWRSPIPFVRGGRHWTVEKVFGELDAHNLSFPDAVRVLARAGLGVIMPGNVAPFEAGHVLVVPVTSPQLRELFFGSEWFGFEDDTSGDWTPALRRAPANVIITRREVNRMSINKKQQRCTLVIVGRALAQRTR